MARQIWWNRTRICRNRILSDFCLYHIGCDIIYVMDLEKNVKKLSKSAKKMSKLATAKIYKPCVSVFERQTVLDLWNHIIYNNLIWFSILSLIQHSHWLLASSAMFLVSILILPPCDEISDVSVISNFSAFVRTMFGYRQCRKKRNHQNRTNYHSLDHFSRHHWFFQKHDFHQTKLFAVRSASAGLVGLLGGLRRTSYVPI